MHQSKKFKLYLLLQQLTEITFKIPQYLKCWIECKVLQYCPVWRGLLKASCELPLGARLCSLPQTWWQMHFGHPEGCLSPLTIRQQSICLSDCISCDAPLCPLLGREKRVPQRQEWPQQCKKLHSKPTSTEAFDRWTTDLLITSQNRVSDI